MPSNALKTYQTIENVTLDGRELEAMLLTRSATRLAVAQQRWNEPDHDTSLEEALRYNQKLWTVFQSELMEDGNTMPDEIKRNLLTLSLFIDKRTFEVMSYPAPEKLNILININQNIAAGLRAGAVAGA
jgi:flagellar protein FlaF